MKDSSRIVKQIKKKKGSGKHHFHNFIGGKGEKDELRTDYKVNK